MKHSGILALALLAFNFPAIAEEGESGAIQPVDIFGMEIATDPRISPDGGQVVYVRQSMDIMTDRQRSNLWIVNTAGDDHRPIASGKASFSSPRWTSDGSSLAYVSAQDGAAQIYRRWMDTGATARLTDLTESPSSLTWSPDGNWIAFTMNVPATPAKSFGKAPAKPEGAKWAEDVKVIDSLIYRADGAGFIKPGHNHVFVIPADGGTPRQVTSGDYDAAGPLAWTPDSSAIVFSSNRNEGWEYEPLESELYRVALSGGSISQLTDRVGPDSAPSISPNGRLIAWLGFDDAERLYENTRLYVMDLDGGNRRTLTADLDRQVDNAQWASDSRSLVIQYDDQGNTKLARVSLSGNVTEVASDLGGTSLGRPYSGGSFTLAGNDRVAYTHAEPDRPADIRAGRLGRSVTQVTHLNDDLLGHKTLGRIEELWVKSGHDGLDVQGWVAYPPNYETGKAYPLILEIHGGPVTNYGPRFSAEVQLYAAAGYVVLYMNPRGSDSYGADFVNLIHHNYPSEDYDDLMAGVDALIEQGVADPDQLYVTGGSGGGVLSSWIVGKTDRFRAAVVAKPVINWASFSLTSDFYNYFSRYWFGAEPWEDPESYWKRSPLSLVGNVSTPTMLLTGEADNRTPISETEQYYQALKLRKVDTAMVRVPGASHGIAARPSNLIAKVTNILGWFEKYNGDGEDKAE